MQIIVTDEVYQDLENAIKSPMTAREAIIGVFEHHNPVIASILDRLDELTVVAYQPHRIMVLKQNLLGVRMFSPTPVPQGLNDCVAAYIAHHSGDTARAALVDQILNGADPEKPSTDDVVAAVNSVHTAINQHLLDGKSVEGLRLVKVPASSTEMIEHTFISEPGMVAAKPSALKHWMVDGERFDDETVEPSGMHLVCVNADEMAQIRTFKSKPFAAVMIRRLIGEQRNLTIDNAVDQNRKIRFLQSPGVEDGTLDFQPRIFYPYLTTETLKISEWEKKLKVLHITVGLPRSGKSTWAKQQGVPIVSLDAIRLALHGQEYLQEAEDHVNAIAKTMIKALFNAGHRHVILDSTAITKDRRMSWFSTQYRVMYHNFDVCKGICTYRACDIGKHHLVPVIERMAATRDEIDWRAENAFGLFTYIMPAQ